VTNRTKSKAFKEFRQYELLNTRVCDLPLKIDGLLRDCILQLYKELKRKKIVFRPRFYLGAELDDGWGCVDGTCCIEVPFYLANRELMDLHRGYYADVESRDEIMKVLRHETGHAVNYAYKLHRKKAWRDLFGNFQKRYPTKYDAKRWSKKHVKHLDLLYAQKHPDDDWAESFAVWLTPGVNWRRRYKGWDAIEKLIYVDIIMKQLGSKRPPTVKVSYDSRASKVRKTLAELYDIEAVAALSEGDLEEYIHDLSQIFMRRVRRRDYHLPACDFLRRYREAIVDAVAFWIMHSNRNTIRKIIRRLEAVARHYDLVLIKSEEGGKLAEVTSLVTWYVINDIYDLA
jgi:hypothetical protein